jgi:hypothetical protein
MRTAKWLLAACLFVVVAGCVESSYRYPNTSYRGGSYWNSSSRDYDRDGVPNRYDRDANGDGIPDRYQR